MRQRWIDSIAAVPPIILIIAFKIFISHQLEPQFRYYIPTQEEVHQQQMRAMNEKRIKHSEMERRFIHPALLRDKLYHVMVHKMQESVAREVLSEYPWLSGKQVKGVAEENLEYDPARHEPVDSRHKNDWDNASIGSTSALSKLDTSGYNTPALYHTQSQTLSTDNLLINATGPARTVGREFPGRNSEDGQLPLLDPYNQPPIGSSGVPYPPTSFGRPPMYRRGTSSSSVDAPLVRYASQDSQGSYTHRPGQNSGGSARDLYPTSRSRQGSVGDMMDTYGQRSRQGSVGDGLDQYGRTPQRPRQGSIGNNLDQYGRPLPRQGSAGSNLNMYGTPSGSRSNSPYGGPPSRY